MSKPLSRRQVFRNECGEAFDRHSYLEQHFQRKHPGKPCREKKQSSLLDHMRAGSKRACPTVEDELPSKKADSGESSSKEAPACGSQHDINLKEEPQPSTSSGSTASQNPDMALLSQIQKVLDQWSSSTQVTQSPSQPTPLLFTVPPQKLADDS